MTTTKPHYYGHRERLRKRFLNSGLEGLADYEIVEMLLTLAIPRRDVKGQAKALIKHFGNLRGILDAPIDEVKKVDGIGEVTPVVLRMMREIVSLYLQQTIEKQEALSDPNRLHEFWRVKIGNSANEVFMVGYLDSGYRLLRDGIERLEEGTTDRATVYPRRVVEAALRRKAAAIMLAHNHPNGDTRPSTVSQKFCSQKRQGKSLKLRSTFDPLPRDTEIRSTKSEIRNNLKTAMSKIQNKLQPSHGLFCFGHSYFDH